MQTYKDFSREYVVKVFVKTLIVIWLQYHIGGPSDFPKKKKHTLECTESETWVNLVDPSSPEKQE